MLIGFKKLRKLQTFSALKYLNYRLWFGGQIVSLFGTWMQSTALGFLIYDITKSPAYLGYVTFAPGLASWLFMLYGGIVADRISRRTLMIITQTAMMALAFILAALTFLNLVQPWHIILLSFLLGVANAFDAPARLALVNELVDRQDLTNAIALNSTMFNTATVLGPTLAGIFYAILGPGWCFMINGVSFIAVIGALGLMRLRSEPKQIHRASVHLEFKEGLEYVLSNSTVLNLIILIGVVSFLGISFSTLYPAWAVDVLGGDVTTNGLLRSAQGIGALLGALSIASLGRFRYRGRLLTVGTFAFPIFILMFSAIRWIPLSLLILVGVGAASILIMNLANSLVQTNVLDDLRGRVMSIYSLIFFGFMSLGSLAMGLIADQFNEPTAVILGGSGLLFSAILIWIFVPRLRALE
jgi:MFS family permease